MHHNASRNYAGFKFPHEIQSGLSQHFYSLLRARCWRLVREGGHQIVCSDMDKWSGMRGQCCNDPGNINVNRKIGPVVSLVTANTDGAHYSYPNTTEHRQNILALGLIYGPPFRM